MIVRRASGKDAMYIAKIEGRVFGDAWSEDGIYETMNQKTTLVFVAEDKGQILGYVIFYYVLDEGEIARIACAPEFRRQGAGSLLFRALEEESRKRGIRIWHLDVRESNKNAIAFYRRHKFAEDGVRKFYYENPKENAVLMSRSLETVSAVQQETEKI
nr:ribosomal protein S18-alanine N-acetyltransferase [uncultured Sellimonas sp.]